MVGMFVSLCLASQKPSKREFFVPAQTDFGVKLLRSKTESIAWVEAKNEAPQFEGEAMRELGLFLFKDFEILMMSSMTCQSNLSCVTFVKRTQ